ncbi:glutamyl-tRNA reductase [Ruania halotolerans]|uniref:glutamyl-tRNA reductase n=1 Tax=Ruania halotolerans TaxID=2897773 RepID=UPI001E36454A|nr:glutamyl-tRNA reductase [Ruania halotolerans]UFU07774.1 glutamyl-tRNA reductase [Ruania halotolerans]
MSASHRTADFSLLERLSSGHGGAATHLTDPEVRGAVVVATCNRYESYLDVEADSDTAAQDVLDRALERIAANAGLTEPELRPRTRMMKASRVAAHLFAVASGLDSVVLGEDEIAGQVRRSLADARKAGTTTASLERLFQMASATSRGVKNTTKINAAGRSMVRLALDLAETRLPSWSQTKVLIIGTGAYARTTLAALRDRGVGVVDVASPSGRERRFAVRDGVQPISHENRAASLAAADLVITSTNVVALSTADLSAAGRDPGHSLLVIDLGLPANVDKDVAHHGGVDLLDLETISLHAPVQELNASAEAFDLVDQAAKDFEQRSAEDSAAPAIVAYRTHVEQVLEAELARARARGDEDDETERALRHFASVLIHTPTTRAREAAAGGRLGEVVAAMRTLYGIEVAADGEPPQASQSGTVALP